MSVLNVPSFPNEVLLEVLRHVDDVSPIRLINRHFKSLSTDFFFDKISQSPKSVDLNDVRQIEWAEYEPIASKVDTLKLYPHLSSAQSPHEIAGRMNQLRYRYSRLQNLRKIVVVAEHEVRTFSWSRLRQIQKEQQDQATPYAVHEPARALSILLSILASRGVANKIDTIEIHEVDERIHQSLRLQLLSMPNLKELVVWDSRAAYLNALWQPVWNSRSSRASYRLVPDITTNLFHCLDWDLKVAAINPRFYGLPYWKLQKCRIGIIPRRGHGHLPIFTPIGLPLPIKSLCRNAARCFGYGWSRSNLRLEIERVDHQRYLFHSDRYIRYRQIEFTANKAARNRFELFLLNLLHNAPFWSEPRDQSEYCDAICRLV